MCLWRDPSALSTILASSPTKIHAHLESQGETQGWTELACLATRREASSGAFTRVGGTKAHAPAAGRTAPAACAQAGVRARRQAGRQAGRATTCARLNSRERPPVPPVPPLTAGEEKPLARRGCLACRCSARARLAILSTTRSCSPSKQAYTWQAQTRMSFTARGTKHAGSLGNYLNWAMPS